MLIDAHIPNLRLWCHFPMKEQLFSSPNENILHFLIRLHTASSLILWHLAKRTPVEHWGSYSQSTHKTASPHSPTRAESPVQMHFLRVQSLGCSFVSVRIFWMQVTTTHGEKTSKQTTTGVPQAMAALSAARNAVFPEKQVQRSLGAPPLLSPALLLSRDCPSSLLRPLLASAPYPSPPETNAHHRFWSQVQKLQGRAPMGSAWVRPGSLLPPHPWDSKSLSLTPLSLWHFALSGLADECITYWPLG